jgi:hypothetical protein
VMQHVKELQKKQKGAAVDGKKLQAFMKDLMK